MADLKYYDIIQKPIIKEAVEKLFEGAKLLR